MNSLILIVNNGIIATEGNHGIAIFTMLKKYSSKQNYLIMATRN